MSLTAHREIKSFLSDDFGTTGLRSAIAASTGITIGRTCRRLKTGTRGAIKKFVTTGLIAKHGRDVAAVRCGRVMRGNLSLFSIYRDDEAPMRGASVDGQIAASWVGRAQKKRGGPLGPPRVMVGSR
jgi:hypothetical protein